MTQLTTSRKIAASDPGIFFCRGKSPMLRWVLVLCMLLAGFAPQKAKAITLTIGTGTTTTSYYPIYTFYGYNYSQSTYLASELVAAGATAGTPGFISSISYYATTYYSGFTTLCKDWVVYMGNTSKSTFSGTTDWVPLSGLTKVFDGVAPCTGTGWFTISFPTPFYWDGSSNLVVAVDENTPSYTSTMSWQATSRTGTRSISYYNDGTNPNPASPPTANTSGAITPNIQLNYTPATPCGSSVTGGTAVASATTLCPGASVLLNTTGSTAGTGLAYVWDSAASGTGPWAAVSGTLTFPNFTYTPPGGRTLYYRCRITCTATAATATSTTVAVTVGTTLTPPYTETFEGTTAGVNVPCAAVTGGPWGGTTAYAPVYDWTILSGASTSYPVITNHTPGGSKYLTPGYYDGTYYSTANPPAYWYTPGIDLQSGKTYRFSYWYVTPGPIVSSALYTFGMYVGTTQTATGLVAIKPDLVGKSNTAYEQTVGDFTVASSGIYYLAIKIDKGYYYYGNAIDDINLIELPPCNTATATTFGKGGKAAATPNVMCSTPSTTTLSISSTPAFSGLSFAWEVATGTPTSFTATAGTTATYVHTIPSGGTYYFRCKVSCTATGLSAYSDTVKVITTPITPPYVEDFESGLSGVNLPCASFTGTFASGTIQYWDLKTSPYSPSYPGVTNHTTGGTKYLYAGYYMGSYSGTGAQFWFTPGLALTAGKAYNFSLWFSNTAYTGYIGSNAELGIRAGTSQTAAGMIVTAGADTVIRPNDVGTPTYNKLTRGFIAPSTGTYYVGIRYNPASGNPCYPGIAIDDLGLDQLPPCSAKPSAGTASASPAVLCSSTSTSVLTLAGVSVASDLVFQWQSAPSATGPWTNISGATLPGYTTPTPAAMKWYRCYVVCPLVSAPNADTSLPVQVKTTPITPPYFEDFESGKDGINMPCAANTSSWTATTYWYLRAGGFSTSYPAIVNHTPGGNKYIHAGYALGSYSTGATEYWFTPALALTASKAYEVSYWFNGSGYSGGATMTGIAAGTAQNAASMTILAGTDTIVNTTSYLQIKRSFISPTTGNYYVGVKVNNLVYSYPGVAFDDIGVNQLPPCSGKPVAGTAMCTPSMICTSGTTVLSLKGTSMASDLTFQWYDVTAGLPGTLIAGATGVTYTTPTLTAMKKYRCVVTCPLASAPNADTSSIIVVNVGAITPPYKEDFEGATIGTNVPCAAYTYSWGSTSYWYLYGAPFSPSYPAIKNNTPGGSKYLYAGYYLGTYYSGAAQYWFSPAIKFTAGATYEFSYWYSGSAYAGGATTLGMYYGTSQTAAAMTGIIMPDKLGVNTGTYKQLSGRFVAPATANYYLGIKVSHTTYSYPGIALDDIGLEQLPPCTGKATAGAISSTPTLLCSSGTLSLNMDLGGVSKVGGLSYQWQSSTSGPTSGFVDIGTPLTAPMYTTGTISTSTWFRCIVKCVATGDTTHSSVIKVDVGAITPPYIETFEGVTPGTNAPCASYTYSWGSGAYWYTYGAPFSISYPAMDNHTPGGSNYLGSGYYPGYYSGADEFWFSPAIKFTGGKLYQVSMWYNGSGYGGGKTNIGLYYGTAQTKAAMTTAIGSDLIGVNTTTYKLIARKFTPPTSGNFYLGIKVNHTTYAYPGIAIDDIGLQEVPPCSSTVVAGTITSDPVHVCAIGGTATFDLTGSTLATGLAYNWLSAPTALGPWTPTGGTTLPYTTSLSAPTWFRCVVTCGATGATDTTAPFKIGVGGMDLPYKEDFETTGTGQVPLCSDATCWGPYYYNGWMVYTGLLTGSYTNNTPGGKNWLVAGYYLGYTTDYCGNPASENNYWYTPGFNFRAGYKYNLSFYFTASSGSGGNKLGVYYGATQSVGGMTNTIKPLTLVTNTTYTKFDTTFKVTSSGLRYIGLRKAGPSVGSYTLYGIAFDDINLNYAPCDDMPMAGGVIGSVSSGTALCKGSLVALADTGATLALVPGIKYQWYRRPVGGTGSGTMVAGATDTVLVSDTLIGYEYRLAVTCTNVSLTAYSNWHALPQLPPHPPVVLSAAGGTSFCLGDTVKLNATNYTGAVYDWLLDGKTVPGWKFSDMGATEPGTYVVKVTSAASPCPGYSNPLTLTTIDPGFKVDVTTPADSILCVGDAIILSAMPSKPGVTFKWRKDNVEIPGATGSTYTVTSGGYYRVAAYDGISLCPAVSRNILFIVKPNPPATISIPGGTLTACDNVGVLLEANKGGYTYQWYRNGSPIFGWVDSSALAKSPGIYTVKVRTADGCINISSGVTVSILPSPTPIISLSGLTLSTTGTYVAYKWYRNGTFTGITTPTLSLVYNGLYTVVVTDVNGCEGESMPMEIMMPGLGINNVNVTASDIRIYPNPAESKVQVESPVAVRVEVKDVTGRVVFKQSNVREVDMSKYADGIYMFSISNKDGVLIKKEKVSKVSK